MLVGILGTGHVKRLGGGRLYVTRRQTEYRNFRAGSAIGPDTRRRLSVASSKRALSLRIGDVVFKDNGSEHGAEELEVTPPRRAYIIRSAVVLQKS